MGESLESRQMKAPWFFHNTIQTTFDDKLKGLLEHILISLKLLVTSCCSWGAISFIFTSSPQESLLVKPTNDWSVKPAPLKCATG
jgi:hypothetical protein